MITCCELAELLLDFASGQVVSERREHVERHLRSCLSCTAYVQSYHLIIQMSRQLPRPSLPPHLTRQLRAILEEEACSGNIGDQGRSGSEEPEP